MSEPSESCQLVLSASECSQATNPTVSAGSLSETTQVEITPEHKDSDLKLCSVENDNLKLRLDAGDQDLSENSEKANKEDLQTAGKPVRQLVGADVAGDGSLTPTAHREIEHVSGSKDTADQSALPGILPHTQGREAQSGDSPLDETPEPEAVPETQCEEQEEKLQVKEKQINEDGSLADTVLSQRFIVENEVECHEDMEVEFADGSCKNSKNLSDQAQELEKIEPEIQGKETSKDCTLGTGEAKSPDKLSLKAALETMPQLSERLSKPPAEELLEQHNHLFPKLKREVPSEAMCAKKHPGCSELGQIMITGNQPPLQGKGLDMLVTQEENEVPKDREDAVRTRGLEQEEQMQAQEEAAAESPSPCSGKWV